MDEKNNAKIGHPRGFWGKVWHFLWYEDSILSWIVNVLLVFIIIKFLLYPAVGLATGTKFPVVAVVSPSMEHNGMPFDQWWTLQEQTYTTWGITKASFENYPLRDGFDTGDIIILVGKKPQDVKIGDVIVYQSLKPYPIIHRVVDTDAIKRKFQTKGDNNLGQIVGFDLNEQNVSYDSLLGKAVFRIPYLGYVKIGVVAGLNKIGIPIQG